MHSARSDSICRSDRPLRVARGRPLADFVVLEHEMVQEPRGSVQSGDDQQEVRRPRAQFLDRLAQCRVSRIEGWNLQQHEHGVAAYPDVRDAQHHGTDQQQVEALVCQGGDRVEGAAAPRCQAHAVGRAPQEPANQNESQPHPDRESDRHQLPGCTPSQRPGDHFPGGSTGLPPPGFGTSPMTVFSGQTENAGHFAHPTASAMGQSVMAAPPAVKG